MQNSFRKILPVVAGAALTITSCGGEEKNYEVRTVGSNNLIELLNDADTKNEFLIRDKGLNSRIARSINKVQDLDTLHCDLVTRRKINDEKISNKKISYEISNKYSVGDNIKVGSNEFKIEDIEPVYVVKKTSEEGQ